MFVSWGLGWFFYSAIVSAGQFLYFSVDFLDFSRIYPVMGVRFGGGLVMR